MVAPPFRFTRKAAFPVSGEITARSTETCVGGVSAMTCARCARCDEVEVAWHTNSELVITAAGQPKQHLSEHLNVTIRVQQP